MPSNRVLFNGQKVGVMTNSDIKVSAMSGTADIEVSFHSHLEFDDFMRIFNKDSGWFKFGDHEKFLKNLSLTENNGLFFITGREFYKETPPQHYNCRSAIVSIEEEKTMKTENIASMMIEGLKTIAIAFDNSGKLYTYKTMGIFEVDDKVVVEVNNQLKIVKVVQVHKVPQIDVESNIKYNWVIQKVDTTQYSMMKEKEQAFSEHLLELQQQSVRKNAASMLSEKLGIDEKDLLKAGEILKIENKE